MPTDCLFCKIIAGDIPCKKVYEDNDTFAFLDIGPVSRGHTLIVPKRHATDLNSGTGNDALAIMNTLYLIAPKIIKALGASGYNLGMNHGLSAGQDIFHTHLHLIPRYDGELRRFDKTNPSQEELNEVGDLLRAQME